MKKSLIILLTFFVFLAFTYNTYAENKEPEIYIVQKGDTLWSISYSHFDDYFLWPRLWNFNPHITNPDYIYPGTKIRIPSREELMKIPFIPQTVKKPKRSKPTVVFKHSGKTPQHIISRELYIRSGWIAKSYPSIGELLSSPTERQIVGNGDIVYIKLNNSEKPQKTITKAPAALVLTLKKPEEFKRFYSIRNVKTVVHPITGKTIGYQIRITGVVELIGKDNDIPKAQITMAYEDIQIGDGLLPFTAMDPPYVPDLSRTPDIQGYMIESQMNSRILGIADIVYLDKGRDDGVRVGDQFSAISESRIKRSVGTIQIVSVQPTTSTAYILESKTELIIGSMWGKKI